MVELAPVFFVCGSSSLQEEEEEGDNGGGGRNAAAAAEVFVPFFWRRFDVMIDD